MDDSAADGVEALKAELELFGERYDATARGEERMLNITRDTGELLAVLVRATAARHVLEIGTSNGYSTLWLADAARNLGAVLITVENDATKIAHAARTFERAGFSNVIRQVHDDAGRFLAASADDAYDFVFLDSDRSRYVEWWPDVCRVLCVGGLLVVDNATSHADEVAPIAGHLGAHGAFTTCVVPVGKGELLAVKRH